MLGLVGLLLSGFRCCVVQFVCLSFWVWFVGLGTQLLALLVMFGGRCFIGLIVACCVGLVCVWFCLLNRFWFWVAQLGVVGVFVVSIS